VITNTLERITRVWVLSSPRLAHRAVDLVDAPTASGKLERLLDAEALGFALPQTDA
jgi:hypothetical protein